MSRISYRAEQSLAITFATFLILGWFGIIRNVSLWFALILACVEIFLLYHFLQ